MKKASKFLSALGLQYFEPALHTTRMMLHMTWCTLLELRNTERGFAASVLNGHLTAASTLSSISLVLCSLIGALLGNSSNFLTDSFILGNASRSTRTIKYMAVLSCFFVAFVCFVQTSRHFVHGSFLLCMPVDDKDGEVVKCLRKAVKRGSIFWAFGLRALYFATTLLLWIFGPIPMFVGSVATVVLLYNLDFNKETGKITYEQSSKSEHNTKSNGVENGVLASGTDASIDIQDAVLRN
ncbi:hypothetical protein HanRHA438_Chr03g0127051 [Helianthus annuus]|nr:hypothetical protein HanHA300_Chr03g0096121 [Helianthus annuus]KAJ0608371.1 hypothetical protein HanHA89_Chr03g0107811 [Helianthus annuus]KAJ0768435.1 hypothetical protein HanLR1_Chr03g0101181 [Helianthus annuus]KAJ0774186.1 hypothetical protein HanOQP8_Chr03g0108711 [Helianthus annuus]KAJ0936105.1 hypothetical protein HanRHA438_Chr03g0127051 [Helianthus annuus]